MQLKALERELQKRWAYPYHWGGQQNDRRDRQTNFIYHTSSFDALLRKTQAKFGQNPHYDAWLNYALNRWYNFWSAKGVESLFAASDLVTPARDERDRLVDFCIQHVRFDHKTTIFPRAFDRDLDYARRHPKALITWLYQHQSQGGRKHLKNRLFIVLHAPDGRHWRLKAELTWLKHLIDQYLATFAHRQLHRFSFEPNTTTLSDIIWGVKGKGDS